MSDFFRKLFGSGGKSKAGGSVRDQPVEKLIAELPFEAVVVKRAAALDAVRTAHRERPDRHAFMISGTKDLGMFVEFMQNGPPPEKTLKAAEGLTVEAWRGQMAEDAAHLEEEFGEIEGPQRSEWPDEGFPSNQFGSEHDLPTFGNDRVIAFSPAPLARWWETFAHTRFGGWNDCPAPEVHVMVGRLWAEQHGAVLISHSHDMLEFAIARPVATREEALAMAELHYAYCGDQLNDLSLDEYAASLIGATVWAFWWD